MISICDTNSCLKSCFNAYNIHQLKQQWFYFILKYPKVKQLHTLSIVQSSRNRKLTTSIRLIFHHWLLGCGDTYRQKCFWKSLIFYGHNKRFILWHTDKWTISEDKEGWRMAFSIDWMVRESFSDRMTWCPSDSGGIEEPSGRRELY